MIIKDPLIHPYEVNVGENQYVLRRKTKYIDKKHNPIYNNIASFNHLSGVISYIVRKQLCESNKIVDLKDYIIEYSKQIERLEKLFLK